MLIDPPRLSPEESARQWGTGNQPVPPRHNIVLNPKTAGESVKAPPLTMLCPATAPATAPPRATALTMLCPVEGSFDLSESERDRGIKLALGLADKLSAQRGRTLTARDAGFELARLLIGAGSATPDNLAAVAVPFAEQLRFKPPAVLRAVMAGWAAVRRPVGEDTFDLAVRAAAAAAASVTITPDPGAAHVRVALVAWQLHVAAGGKEFAFPTTRLAQAFGVHRSTVAESINRLMDRRVIECTGPDYSFRRHKARRFRFVGAATVPPRGPA